MKYTYVAASVLSSVEPVASVVISVIFLSMRFHWMDFVGFILILATIPLIALGDYRQSLKPRQK